MQIASRGIKVHLYEMKPNKKTPAHHTEKYAELVCSNSLKAMRVESAAGLLKEEMRRLDSFLMKCADACKVPAGGALAVDRDIFSSLATEGIKSSEWQADRLLLNLVPNIEGKCSVPHFRFLMPPLLLLPLKVLTWSTLFVHQDTIRATVTIISTVR